MSEIDGSESKTHVPGLTSSLTSQHNCNITVGNMKYWNLISLIYLLLIIMVSLLIIVSCRSSLEQEEPGHDWISPLHTSHRWSRPAPQGIHGEGWAGDAQFKSFLENLFLLVLRGVGNGECSPCFSPFSRQPVPQRDFVTEAIFPMAVAIFVSLKNG